MPKNKYVKVVYHNLFVKGEKWKSLSNLNSNHMTEGNIIETDFSSIVIIGKTPFAKFYTFLWSQIYY